jgi:hypothetical protein
MWEPALRAHLLLLARCDKFLYLNVVLNRHAWGCSHINENVGAQFIVPAWGVHPCTGRNSLRPYVHAAFYIYVSSLGDCIDQPSSYFW